MTLAGPTLGCTVAISEIAASNKSARILRNGRGISMTRISKTLVFALLLTGSALNQGIAAEPKFPEPLVEAWKLIESTKMETSEARVLDALRRAEAVIKDFLITHPDDEAANRIAGGTTVGGLSLDNLRREVEIRTQERAALCAETPGLLTYDCVTERSEAERLGMKKMSKEACDLPATPGDLDNSCHYFGRWEAGYHKDRRWKALKLEGLVAVGDLGTAMSVWEQEKGAFDPSRQQRLMVMLAEGLVKTGFAELGRRLFTEARDFAISRLADNKTRLSEALLRIAKAEVRVGMSHEARKTVSKAPGDQLISGRNREGYVELVEVRIAARMMDGGNLDETAKLLRQIGDTATSPRNRSILVEINTQFGLAEAGRGNAQRALTAFRRATSIAGDGSRNWSAIGEELYDCPGGCTTGPYDRAREAVKALTVIAVAQHAANLNGEAVKTLVNAELAAGELSEELSGAMPDALAEIAAARAKVQGRAAGHRALEKAVDAWKKDWADVIWNVFMAGRPSGPLCSYDSDFYSRRDRYQDFVQAHIIGAKPNCDRGFAAASFALGEDPVAALTCDGSETIDQAQQASLMATIGAEELAADSQTDSPDWVTTVSLQDTNFEGLKLDAYWQSWEEAEEAKEQREIQEATDWEVGKFAERLAKEREWSSAVQMTRHISDPNDRAQALISIALLQLRHGRRAEMKATLSEAVTVAESIPDWEGFPQRPFDHISEHERNTGLDRALRFAEIAAVLGRDITTIGRRP